MEGLSVGEHMTTIANARTKIAVMTGILLGSALLIGVVAGHDADRAVAPAKATVTNDPLPNAALLPLTIESEDERFLDLIGEPQTFLETLTPNTLVLDARSGDVLWENSGSNLTSIYIQNLLGLPGVPPEIPAGVVLAGFSLFSPGAPGEYAGDNYIDMALLEDGSLYLPSTRLVHGVYQVWYDPVLIHPDPAEEYPDPEVDWNPSGVPLATFDTSSLDIPPNELNSQTQPSLGLDAPGMGDGESNPCRSPGARRNIYRGTTDQWTPVGSVSSPYGGSATYENSKWEKKALFFVAYGSKQTVGTGHSIAASNGDTRHAVQLMRWSLNDVYECSRYGTSGWVHVDNLEQVINKKPTGTVMKGEVSVMGAKRETGADDIVSGSVCSGSQCYPLVWTDIRYKRSDTQQYYTTSVTETITTTHDRWIAAGLSVGHKFFGINAVDFKAERGTTHSAKYTMPAGYVNFDYLGKVDKSNHAFCVTANGQTCP